MIRKIELLTLFTLQSSFFSVIGLLKKLGRGRWFCISAFIFYTKVNYSLIVYMGFRNITDERKR